ncbi:Beta-1,4-galactosyltransferase 4 [Porphyridium purpureum]|uniref:Beta-1,4-galactosyltransferase 4 n=1 Tax=Porphyridium purpureum TaxID=35688 RepID=A0A5J4Z4P2_PORPP|nr:Beta-1,4-galactosyltransferase 4 [Porphyridium purpureum]|eukprot:POR4888..scf295_1
MVTVLVFGVMLSLQRLFSAEAPAYELDLQPDQYRDEQVAGRTELSFTKDQQWDDLDPSLLMEKSDKQENSVAHGEAEQILRGILKSMRVDTSMHNERQQMMASTASTTRQIPRVAVVISTEIVRDERVQVISRYLASLMREASLPFSLFQSSAAESQTSPFELRVVAVSQSPTLARNFFKGFLYNLGFNAVRAWATHVLFLDPSVLPLSIEALDPHKYDRFSAKQRREQNANYLAVIRSASCVSGFNWTRIGGRESDTSFGAVFGSVHAFERTAPFPNCQAHRKLRPELSVLEREFMKRMNESKVHFVDLPCYAGGAFYSLLSRRAAKQAESVFLKPPLSCWLDYRSASVLAPTTTQAMASSAGGVRIAAVTDALSHLELVVEFETSSLDQGTGDDDAISFQEDAGFNEQAWSSKEEENIEAKTLERSLELDDIALQFFLAPHEQQDSMIEFLGAMVASGSERRCLMASPGSENPPAVRSPTSNRERKLHPRSKSRIGLKFNSEDMVVTLEPCAQVFQDSPSMRWRKRPVKVPSSLHSDLMFQLEWLDLATTRTDFSDQNPTSNYSNRKVEPKQSENLALCLSAGKDSSKHFMGLHLSPCHTVQSDIVGSENQLWRHSGLAQIRLLSTYRSQAWCLAVESTSIEPRDDDADVRAIVGVSPCLDHLDLSSFDPLRTRQDFTALDTLRNIKEKNGPASVGDTRELRVVAGLTNDMRIEAEVFARYMDSLLRQQCVPNFEILLVHQTDGQPLNRGALNNAAFREMCPGSAKGNCAPVWDDISFAFHDLRWLPMAGVSYLAESAQSDAEALPSTLVSNRGTRVADPRFTGLAMLFSSAHSYLKVNGYANDHWGTGFEDRDLLPRLMQAGLTKHGIPARRDPEAGIFYELYHPHVLSMPPELSAGDILALERTSRARLEIALRDKEAFKQNGLNSVSYRVLNLSKHTFCTKLQLQLSRKG